MPVRLHILTKPQDEIVDRILESQRADTANQVVVVDLTAPEPDYTGLVERVFAADSIATW